MRLIKKERIHVPERNLIRAEISRANPLPEMSQNFLPHIARGCNCSEESYLFMDASFRAGETSSNVDVMLQFPNAAGVIVQQAGLQELANFMAIVDDLSKFPEAFVSVQDSLFVWSRPGRSNMITINGRSIEKENVVYLLVLLGSERDLTEKGMRYRESSLLHGVKHAAWLENYD